MCVMHTYATCQGVLTTLGSYNKYNRNCYRDCMALCCLSCVTGIFAGFIVFSVFGFLAHVQGLDMYDVATFGPSLIFKAVPLALSVLPGSTFWTVLFFLTVFLLAVDSQVCNAPYKIHNPVSSENVQCPLTRGCVINTARLEDHDVIFLLSGGSK
ncbi:unnamed protein product [Pleuronectes platessa]|uniref:Uncharacterized protein n=1 Tax=Pleuronectes platessa TaxID=8262 RepID=A0A9N7Z0W9_PLEPL|nr:unnamed protein product [Pleuronectes platessa]